MKTFTEEQLKQFPALSDKYDPNWDKLYESRPNEPFWMK